MRGSILNTSSLWQRFLALPLALLVLVLVPRLGVEVGDLLLAGVLSLVRLATSTSSLVPAPLWCDQHWLGIVHPKLKVGILQL